MSVIFPPFSLILFCRCVSTRVFACLHGGPGNRLGVPCLHTLSQFFLFSSEAGIVGSFALLSSFRWLFFSYVVWFGSFYDFMLSPLDFSPIPRDLSQSPLFRRSVVATILYLPCAAPSLAAFFCCRSILVTRFLDHFVHELWNLLPAEGSRPVPFSVLSFILLQLFFSPPRGSSRHLVKCNCPISFSPSPFFAEF